MSTKAIGVGLWAKCDKENGAKKVTSDSYVVVTGTEQENDGAEQKCTMMVLPDEVSVKIVSKYIRALTTGAQPLAAEKDDYDRVVAAMAEGDVR